MLTKEENMILHLVTAHLIYVNILLQGKDQAKAKIPI